MKKSKKRNVYGSPRWSAEIMDCSVPMSLDTYSKCSYNCAYCFSQYQKDIGVAKANYRKGGVRWVNIDKVIRIFSGETKSQFREFVRQRKVIQWGGLSDPFDEHERKYGITLQLLSFFKEIQYPITFSTKATWWIKDKRYRDLFDGADFWSVKVSIISADEKKVKAVERGCPSTEERIGLIKELSKINVGRTVLRLRPFIIGMSNPGHLELIERCADAGAGAMSTEFFCLEGRATERIKKNYEIISEAAGFDVPEFYKKYSLNSGYQRLNRNVKRGYIDEMEGKCREVGMKFYVSDAQFKERCDGGSCCAIPEEWNYSRGQGCYALQVAKKKGFVKFSDLKPDILIHEGYLFWNAENFNTGATEKRAKFWTMTMYQYLRYLWNTPNQGQSPYRMFEGILKPDGTRDEEGDLIYYYDETKA